MNKWNVRLLGLLGVQIALAIAFFVTGDGHAIGKPRELLPGFDRDAVTALSIYDGEGTEKTPSPLEIKKVGNAWKLVSHHDYPALESKVSSALAALVAMKSRGPIATSKNRHAQLSVADQDCEHRVVIASATGTTTLFVGKPSGGAKIAVRVDGSDDVHSVTGITSATFSTRVSDWLEKQYLDVEAAKIARFSVSNEAGTFDFNRSGDATWTASFNGDPVAATKNQELDSDKISALLEQARNVTVKEPASPAEKLGTPIATFTLTVSTTTEGASNPPAATPAAGSNTDNDYVIDVFRANDTVIVRDRSKAPVVVADSEMSELLELKREKLLNDKAKPGEKTTAPLGNGFPVDAFPGGAMPVPE